MTMHRGNAGAPAQSSGKFAIFKLRDFRYYWIGTIFSNVGEHIENVIRNWLIWELTHSVFWMMVMVFMHWVPFAVLSLPAGSLSERVNRQRLIIWTEAVDPFLVIYADTVFEMERRVILILFPRWGLAPSWPWRFSALWAMSNGKARCSSAGFLVFA